MNPIWWCEEHEIGTSDVPDNCPAIYLGWGNGNPCRMVKIVFEPEERHFYIIYPEST